MPEIVFNEALHTYHVDGLQRPSVTQIIFEAGLIDSTWWTDEARERGKAVHAASHYLDENDLDRSTVSESHKPYLDAWERFKTETAMRIELIEQRVFHKTLGYCGTLDRVCYIAGATQPLLLDIKTGLANRWHAIQLAAYAETFESPRRFRRGTVHLQKNGRYKWVEYDAADYGYHWDVFRGCISVVHFKHGGQTKWIQQRQ